MTHIHLGLVFHQHQPVGNFDFVFAELLEKSYEPLLAALERHPGVQAGLHYSGPLLDWLALHQPEYLARVRALVERGQVEVLGGGYYEPILPAISEADRVGQMKKMRQAIADRFGRAPAGMWLPERVWEPDLPRSIAAGGYSWTVLDDVHFEGAGVLPESLHGWYVTADQGRQIGVYGSSTAFRYLVPWGSVDDCINYLRTHGDRHPGGLLVMGDDGEKFGGWPTTYAHCWEDGWVDAFFARLEAEAHWIATVRLSEWQAAHEAAGTVYLPSASYMEMGAWSLPPDEQRALDEAKRALRAAGRDDLIKFLRGGQWRNFLVRYPEVTLLRERVAALSAVAHARGDEAALDHLWQAQCNCAYWHGVFGGVYLEHIRHANFAHVAAADVLLHPGPQPPEWADFDADGVDEVALRSAHHTVIVDSRSGEILHWDLRDIAWHLTHVVARRPEAYHQAAAAAHEGDVRSIHDAVQVKDVAALAEIGRYDRGPRVAAQDSLLDAAATPESYREARLLQSPRCTVVTASGDTIELVSDALQKRVTVGEDLTVAYGPTGRPFASEWNLSLPADEHGTRIEHLPGLVTVHSGAVALEGRHNGSSSWHERVVTASNTEGGIELSPQGWALVIAFDGAGPGEIVWSPAR